MHRKSYGFRFENGHFISPRTILKRVIAVNAARKTNNTAALLHKALEGAKSVGAETEIIHLHDYLVNGCQGCMACKMLKNIPPKVCLQKDQLTPVLEKCVYKADSLIIGGPIYFMQPGGVFRSFSERLLYPYFKYGAKPGDNYYPNKSQKAGLIFTMGASKQMIDDFTLNPKFGDSMDTWKIFYQMMFGKVEIQKVYYTFHVKNFKGYELDCLNTPDKKQYNDQTWEKELQAAFEMGKKLAQ